MLSSEKEDIIIIIIIIQSEMDKEEDARMASENERLRRLMLEGVIENPHDYRAIIHGEHTQHRRTKKKKRSKRKVLIIHDRNNYMLSVHIILLF